MAKTGPDRLWRDFEPERFGPEDQQDYKQPMTSAAANPLANRPFLKMNGIGNSIVVLDLRGSALQVGAVDARAIGRGEGLAYDQMMVLYDPVSAGTAARMKIFNIDGSLSGACGNGTRCVAWALMQQMADKHIVLESDAGLLECTREGPWRFTVDMGAPQLGWADIPLRDAVANTVLVTLPDPPPGAELLDGFGAVSMGNPHAVFFVDDIEAHHLDRVGPLIEHHPMFPQRVNVSLAHVVSRDYIDLKVWERGTGLTLACGSAACATLVASVRRDLCGRRATIRLPGGELVIEWRESDGHVLMTGDVELEFEGKFDPSLFAAANA